MSSDKSRQLVIFACGLVLLSQLANYVLAPAFPQLPAEFNVSVSAVQQLISVFLCGFAVVQLLVGPVSDGWGRRVATLLALVFFLAGSALCALSTSMGMLSVGLLIQAMGAGSFPTLAQAVLRDRFDQTRVIGVMSVLATVTACTVSLTPLVSGLILNGMSWRVMFFGLVGVTLPAFGLVMVLMPETLDAEHRIRISPANVGAAYKSLLTNRAFMAYAVSLGLMTGAMAAFFAGAPFVLMGDFGMSYTAFGGWFMLAFSGFVMGTLGGPRLIVHRRWSIQRVAVAGVAEALAGSLAGIGIFQAGISGPVSILVCAFIFSMGLGVALGVGRGAAMSRVSRNIGAASALVSFVIGALAAVVSGIAPVLETHDHDGLFVVTAIVSALALLAVLGAGALGNTPGGSLPEGGATEDKPRPAAA